MAGAVLSGSDYMHLARRERCRSLGVRHSYEEILQTYSRRHGGNGFEKRTASEKQACSPAFCARSKTAADVKP